MKPPCRRTRWVASALSGFTGAASDDDKKRKGKVKWMKCMMAIEDLCSLVVPVLIESSCVRLVVSEVVIRNRYSCRGSCVEW